MKANSCRMVFAALLVTGSISAEGALASAPANRTPIAISSQPEERLTTVAYLSVDSTLWDRVVLIAAGRTATGASIQKKRLLPESFRIEERHYSGVVIDPGEGERTRNYRVLYHHRGRAYIAGRLTKMSTPPWMEWNSMGGELMNVLHGFDVAKQQIWIEPRPEEMPPVPVPFKGGNWKGLRFGIAHWLERFLEQEAQTIIESRGGHVVKNYNDPVDVALVNDDTDFLRTRNKMAEHWMRQGAKVLREKNFPGPRY